MIHYQDGTISIITLDNPERHNALSHEDFATLGKLLDHVEREMPRALILTATGKSFCAGVEFDSLQTGDWINANPLNALCARVADLPMPSIAALNGNFVGGGAELAFSCDLRIGHPKAKCRIPAAAISVHYEPSGIDRVIRVVGEQMARRLFLTLETFSGDDLLAHHFVDALSETPLDDAMKRAEAIAKLAPLALRGMKQSINGQNDDARARIAACFGSEDFKEAMAAVQAKRSPEFKGQ